MNIPGEAKSKRRSSILVDSERIQRVLDTMVEASRLAELGRGMTVVPSVDEVKGIVHREHRRKPKVSDAAP